MKKVTEILLAVVIVVLCYVIFKQIQGPVQFEKEAANRKAVVVKKIKDIRTAQQEYKKAKGKFTNNWDELIAFILEDTIEYRSEIYDENNLENAAILEQLRKQDKNWKNEKIVRVAVKDTIFDIKDKMPYSLSDADIRKLPYIPFTNETKKFELDTATITTAGLQIPVVRCHAAYIDFLDTDTYNQEVWNLLSDEFNLFAAQSQNDEIAGMGLKQAIDKGQVSIRHFGVTFGSLETSTNEAGNWTGDSANE